MKSVKPGRGPSALGVWGAIVAVVFGVVWTAAAASMGAPAVFPIFGVLFIITGVVVGVYHFKNATGKHRYSAFDITEDGEEPDPLQERFGQPSDAARQDAARQDGGAGYCPYCGAPSDAEYAFCRSCGKELPPMSGRE